MRNFRKNLNLEFKEIKLQYSEKLSFFISPIWDTPNPKISAPYEVPWNSEDKLRYQLIDSFSIKKLLKHVDEPYVKIFSSPGFFQINLDDYKVCEILNRWEKGLPVDPPTIIWDSSSKKMIVENGIHRLNTAIKLGVSEVPIIVPNESYFEIFPLL